MTNWLKIGLLAVVLITGVFLAYQPHLGQPYPLLGDEYIHIALAQQFLDEGALPFTNPYFANNPTHINFESGFHFFLAGVFSLTPSDPVLFYKYFVILFMLVNSLLLFTLVKLWSSDYVTSLFSVFFFGTIHSAGGLLTHHYFVPLTLGVSCLFLSHIFFHHWVSGHGKKYLGYLICVLAATAVTYPPTLFFFLGTLVIYLISLDHSVASFFKTSPSRFLKHILAFTICTGALFIGSLYGLNLLDKVVFDPSWDITQTKFSPLIYFGLIPNLFALLGLDAVIQRKKEDSKIIIYWFFIAVTAIYFFYSAGFSILVPFPRLFFFYLIGLSILCGYGVGYVIQQTITMRSKLQQIGVITIILLLCSTHFFFAQKKTHQLPTILDESLYTLLIDLDTQIATDALVISDNVTSLAVYPVSSKHVTNVLNTNIGGGNTQATHAFLTESCAEKKEVFRDFNPYIQNTPVENAPFFVLSKVTQDCDFLKLMAITDSGVYLYSQATGTVSDFQSEVYKPLIPKPSQDIIYPEKPILSEDEIYDLFIDASVTNGVWTERNNSDGKIEGYNDIHYTGYWEVTGGSYCLYVPYKNYGNCFTLGLENDILTYYKMDGSVASQATLPAKK